MTNIWAQHATSTVAKLYIICLSVVPLFLRTLATAYFPLPDHVALTSNLYTQSMLWPAAGGEGGGDHGLHSSRPGAHQGRISTSGAWAGMNRVEHSPRDGSATGITRHGGLPQDCMLRVGGRP